MLTTSENRKITAIVFGWLSFAVGSVAVLCVAAAAAFRLLHGLDRESDGAQALASGVAILALVLGGLTDCYSWFLVRSRLSRVSLTLSVLPLPASIIIARLAGGHW